MKYRLDKTIWLLAILGVACTEPSGDRADRFSMTTAAYELADVVHRIAEGDPDAGLYMVSDVAAVGDELIVAESRNHRLTRLSPTLEILGRVGNEGDGPGEYKHPGALEVFGELLAVLDMGNARLSYLSHEGEFLESVQLPGTVDHLAMHPTLGALVTSSAFEGYYLQRVGSPGPEAFGGIPETLRTEVRAASPMPGDFVAVTRGGAVHVLDAPNLALVTFSPQGALLAVNYLPEWFRARKREERERLEEAFGDGMLGVTLVADLSVMPDGRLLVLAVEEDMLGMVLDLEARTATPLMKGSAPELSWVQGGSAALFDGERLVLTNIAEIAIIETRFVPGAE